MDLIEMSQMNQPQLTSVKFWRRIKSNGSLINLLRLKGAWGLWRINEKAGSPTVRQVAERKKVASPQLVNRDIRLCLVLTFDSRIWLKAFHFTLCYHRCFSPRVLYNQIWIQIQEQEGNQYENRYLGRRPPRVLWAPWPRWGQARRPPWQPSPPLTCPSSPQSSTRLQTLERRLARVSTRGTFRTRGWFQTNYCVEPGLRGRSPCPPPPPPLPPPSHFLLGHSCPDHLRTILDSYSPTSFLSFSFTLWSRSFPAPFINKFYEELGEP